MQDLVENIARILNNRKMQIVTAESCTGGLLSATLTHRAGASHFFDRGFITYTNQSKHELLKVDQEILETFGAVSAETATAMALGALGASNAGIALSVTGIAGPDGGTEQKPVGLVYIGYAIKNGSSGSVEHRFEGDRASIQSQSAAAALKNAIKVLELKI